MAKAAQYFEDDKGQPHKTPEAAIASDLAGILGKVGEGESIAPGIARTLIEKRELIEGAFAQLDEMRRL